MKFILGLLFSIAFLSLSAQDAISVLFRQQLLNDWKRAKTYTLQYLNAMPANKYGFSPADSVRTFAEQMLHLSQSNAGFAFIGTGYRNASIQFFANPDFGKSPGLLNKDSVLYYVTVSYDYMISAVQSMDLSKCGESVSWRMAAGMRTTSRLGWIMKAYEHQTHHRGQCTIYFRLLGIRPPGELLWDE